MLTEDSYITAWVVYGLATACGLLVLNHWLRHAMGVGARSLLLLLLGGLALAPAYPDPSGATWAPALFVAAFTLLTDGVEAAMPAFRSLGAGAALGVVCALLLLGVRRLLGIGRRGEGAA